MLRLLAPTDFSTDGYNATLVAMQLAKALVAEVVFVHAMAKPHVPAASPESLFKSMYQEEERIIRERLLETTQYLFDILGYRHAEVRYKTLVVSPPFTEAMLQVIASESIDLVVMGSRGSSQLKQILIGSNTLELMRLCPIPLLIVPSDVVFNGFENITVLLEQLKLSERSGLDILERIAQVYDASLHFLMLTKDGRKFSNALANLPAHTTWHHLLLRPHTITMAVESEAWAGMETHLNSSKSDLVVLMHERLSIWEALFSKSLSEALAAKAHLPLLVLPPKA